MPVGKSGHFSINPGAVRMHDANPPIASKKGEVAGKKTPDPGEQEGPKGHVELHEGPHEQAPNAKFHTIHHDGSGGEPEVKGHETLHAAHHAINEHMGKDGCVDPSCAEHNGTGGTEEQGAPSAGADDEY